jgi:TonB family protein
MNKVQRSARRFLANVAAVCFVPGFLLAGTAALAQGTQEQTTDNQEQQSTTLSAPLTQVGNMDVLSDTMGVDFAPYLRSSVLPSLRGNWQWTVRTHEPALNTERRLLGAQFAILKDGSVENIKLMRSSGDTELDATVENGIKRSAPFLALPSEFGGQSVELRCYFYYGFGKVIHFEGGGVHGSGTNDGKVWHAGNGLTPPRTTYAPQPEFSEEARRKKVNGDVTLMVTVTESGDVADVKVVKGLGYGLDEKAIETVRTWKFQPATRNGSPVQTDIAVSVSFRIR